MPRLAALRAEWRTHPPAHWLMAAVLKYRPRDEAGAPVQASIAELKAALPGNSL